MYKNIARNERMSCRFDYNNRPTMAKQQPITNDFKQILNTITSKLEEFVRLMPASVAKTGAMALQTAVSTANHTVQSLQLARDYDWTQLIHEVTVMKFQLEHLEHNVYIFSSSISHIAGVMNDAIGSSAAAQITGLVARNEYCLKLIARIGQALETLRRDNGSVFDFLGDATQQTKLNDIFHIMAIAATQTTQTNHVAMWNALNRLAMIIQRQQMGS